MSGVDSLHCEYRQGGIIIRALNRDILEKMEPTIQAIAHLIRTHGARAALIDLREVPGETTFMDRFGLGEQAGRHLPRIPLAVLIHEHMADPERIGKVVARNRGINVEVFTAPPHAEAWFTARTEAG